MILIQLGIHRAISYRFKAIVDIFYTAVFWNDSIEEIGPVFLMQADKIYILLTMTHCCSVSIVLTQTAQKIFWDHYMKTTWNQHWIALWLECYCDTCKSQEFVQINGLCFTSTAPNSADFMCLPKIHTSFTCIQGTNFTIHFPCNWFAFGRSCILICVQCLFVSSVPPFIGQLKQKPLQFFGSAHIHLIKCQKMNTHDC